MKYIMDTAIRTECICLGKSTIIQMVKFNVKHYTVCQENSIKRLKLPAGYEQIGCFANHSISYFIVLLVSKRFLFIVTPTVGVCNCSMFCCTLHYVHSSMQSS